MEANKRSAGIALLVLLLAVSCLAGLSSAARTQPGLDFLDGEINGERVSAFTCIECLCGLKQESSSGAVIERCSCMQSFNGCPTSCQKCIGGYGDYLCLDKIPRTWCQHVSVAVKRMIELPKAMNE